MRFAYILRLILKAVLIISIVLFVVMTVFETTSKDTSEGVELDLDSTASNTLQSGQDRPFRDVFKEQTPENIINANGTLKVKSNSGSEVDSTTDKEKDTGPYLTSREVDSIVLDSKWQDYQKQAEYSLRYWDLIKSENASHIMKTKPIIQEKLDYLWRPVKGQPGAGESTRVVPQLVWQMDALNSPFSKRLKDKPIKKIVVWDSFEWWSKSQWGENQPKQLLQSDCKHTPNSITQCIFTDNRNDLSNVDAVIATRDSFHTRNVPVPEKLLKFYFILESPFHSWVMLDRSEDLLATYWRGSDLITPYAQWAYYDFQVKSKKQEKNYAEGKSKPVAIFVSNCGAWNNRMGYVEELKKYIDVDVYGGCGPLSCEKSQGRSCFEMLKKDYFFYLSFENSNCRDYITEKLFGNGLENEVVPIVLGAHPEDYAAMAPYKSYIHIEEFDDPKELAEYLKFLMQNPTEYNKYFEWKGTGEFIASELFCRLCAMVHYADFVRPPKRTKRFRWGHMQAIESGMCLDRNRWYWTRENNEITNKPSSIKSALNTTSRQTLGTNGLYDLLKEDT